MHYYPVSGIEARLRLEVEDMTHKWEPPDPGHLVERYVTGESEFSIAKSCGVSTNAVRTFLERSGVQRRGSGAANALRMSRMTPEQRAANAAAANAASRGRERSEDELVRTALTRQKIGFGIGRWEQAVAGELTRRGIEVTPQLAVHGYNIDVAAWPLAVEVHSGGGYPDPARYRERVVYLADQGWHSVYVTYVHGRFHVPVVCDQVVSLLKRAERRPPVRGEYWVIRGSSQLPSIIEAHFD
jgi:hypothetical protein